MNNEQKKLVQDTICFLKGMNQDDTLLVSESTAAFFQRKPESKQVPPTPVFIPKSAPPIVIKKDEPKAEVAPPISSIQHSAISTQPSKASLRKLLAEMAPQFTLREEPLDDSFAKKQSQLYKEEKFKEVALIYFGEDRKEIEFMNNLAKAISICIRPAKVIDAHKIEKEKKWQNFLDSKGLNWIIAPKRALRKSTELIQYYKENPATNERFLGKTPIIFIEPLSEYFKNPDFKKILWEELLKCLSA